MEYPVYKVNPRAREPLLRFMLEALRTDGCAIIRHTPATEAPLRISFETAAGERMGIVAYAFLSTFTPTKNRPEDEHTFQMKYGSKAYGEPAKLHELWQDPFGLYTTICCGINPVAGFFVGIDPEMHNPTKFFVRVEFKQHDVDEILRHGWHAWERDVRRDNGEPVEVLVGGTAPHFLQYVRLERAALREDQGHRQLLAERIGQAPTSPLFAPSPVIAPAAPMPAAPMLHALAQEFEMSEAKVLDLIASARRLKMAVRGWVAEEKLVQTLQHVDGVTECARLDEEGGPDVRLRYDGAGPLTVQCKNVLRQRAADGAARLDFQKTRASKKDPCSRYYRPEEFDLIAACLHAVTTRWEFSYAPPRVLDVHKSCRGRLASNVKVNDRWSPDAARVLGEVAASRR